MGRDILGFLKRKKKERKLFKSEIENKHSEEAMRELNMLLLAHSLEKGMGLEEVREGFGQEKANKLLNLLEGDSSNKKKESFGYREAISVLIKYIDFSEQMGTDMTGMRERVRKMDIDQTNMLAAGFLEYNVQEEYNRIEAAHIEHFIKSRHSVRSFLPQKVDDDVMKKVLELVACAPSACNRQPSKIYCTTEKETVASISKLIPGNKGFEDAVPNWAFITTNRSLFNKSEYFQWYVNGGIFLTYFVQALQCMGIGSCIFQIPVQHESVAKIRRIAKIPDNESIVAAVGFGYPQEQIKVLQAARRPVEDIYMKF